MKKVLGLDLGTTSIGWGLVNQAESKGEVSSIIKAGVRVNPLSFDEKDAFEKGKAITTNSDRTLKRSIRRNRQRYQLRRDNLINILKREHWMDDNTLLSENGNYSTFETYRLRAEAVDKEISLEQLSRVFLMINKKRGYKSSRKANKTEEGSPIDGIAVSKELMESGMTPGQYALNLLNNGKNNLPSFYRSDLQAEYDRIWDFQKQYHPDFLTDDLKEKIQGKGKLNCSKTIYAITGVSTADNKGKDKKLNSLKWRVQSLESSVSVEILAYVLSDLGGEISNSSGYLGAISDRSKELILSGKTIGQYLYENIKSNNHYKTRNVVFYRQDYMDEFNRIWDKQSEYHPELNESLRAEIRDMVVFYQRNLKSQKGLISFCEFEQKPITVTIDGKEKLKIRGCRVAPRSSLMFQEFKMWQNLNNITIHDKVSLDTQYLNQDDMDVLAKELSIKGTMSANEVLKALGLNTRKYELNYKTVEGNTTLSEFYRKALEIVELSGHGEFDISKSNASDIERVVNDVFEGLGFSTEFLQFDSSKPKPVYEQQTSFKLWHLLYSYNGDNSYTGEASLIQKISKLCCLPEEYARTISRIHLSDDYASLSHKAISNILPYLKSGYQYDAACAMAGYKHSKASLTKEEIESKELIDKLEILPKGALRNPVVEKIINQMINVINSVSEEYGRPDEIHIEMARELKKNAKQRAEDKTRIDEQAKINERVKKILHDEFGIKDVTRNDILRYKLYEELKSNGYKTLYSNQYIPKEYLFSDKIDIEHIIPQASYFDDSFANKTLEYRDINLDKGKETARDYVLRKYGESGLNDYCLKINDLFAQKVISKGKHFNLLCRQEDIPSDFLNRDLSNSQYIARKATEILNRYVKSVVTTTGSITARLREDWQLVDVMKEINLPKFKQMGMTHSVERNGRQVEKIDDWTKRNDHRHHAMDAITIAFTKQSHIQYFNTLAASRDESTTVFKIRESETMTSGNKRIIAPPMPFDKLRAAFKSELETILVSFKSSSKVATWNINTTQKKGGCNKLVQLTPRGSLHKDTVYGKRRLYETYEVAINSKLDYDVISNVASKAEREALFARLDEFGGDPKKAFTGKNAPEKNQIWIDSTHTKSLAGKVKCVHFNEVFSTRKSVTPDLNLDKVLDTKVRNILLQRLAEFGGDKRKAFSNLEENPLYLDKAKTIPIKKVTIVENLPLVALRNKKNKDGQLILDDSGSTIPVDFVNLRSNHHIAIYRDTDGNLMENVVSFFEAVQRMSDGLPVIDKNYRKEDGWEFMFSLKINEMFIFPDKATDFYPNEIDLLDKRNYAMISSHLFRVQKLSSKDYSFIHHLETSIEANPASKDVQWKRITSLNNLKDVVKVRVSNSGNIISILND